MSVIRPFSRAAARTGSSSYYTRRVRTFTSSAPRADESEPKRNGVFEGMYGNMNLAAHSAHSSRPARHVQDRQQQCAPESSTVRTTNQQAWRDHQERPLQAASTELPGR